MAYYGVALDDGLVFLPFFLILAVSRRRSASGIWLAALNVQYRDVRYVVPFFVQIWLFVTPVIYLRAAFSQSSPRLGLPAGSTA